MGLFKRVAFTLPQLLWLAIYEFCGSAPLFALVSELAFYASPHIPTPNKLKQCLRRRVLANCSLTAKQIHCNVRGQTFAQIFRSKSICLIIYRQILENHGFITHPGAHVSVPSRHFIPHVIPVILAGLPRHVTAPGVGSWATAHRVPIIVHSICDKHDDTLTASSCTSLKQFKGQLERFSVKVQSKKTSENSCASQLVSHDSLQSTPFSRLPRGLTAEYPATRTNFFEIGYAVHRNLLIQVEVCNLF